jgi:hypothetical protein
MTASASPGTLRTGNDSILERLEPYLVVAPWNRDLLDHEPFGLTIPAEHIIDPTRTGSETFLRRLSVLDKLTFGPKGMPMPPWVFYNAAEVPGAIFGFAHRVETLDRPLARRLELAPGATGLMPLSMYIAIPTRAPDSWLGHNLASLNRVLPELSLHGLASITKAIALKAYRCRRQVGAVQWDSPALHVHTRFGPLDLLTAWTPAHTVPATLTYHWLVTDERLRSGLGDPQAELSRPPVEFEVAADDPAAMQSLQMQIESGEPFVVPQRPSRSDDDALRVPIGRA